MAHFAKIEDNYVVDVIVAEQDYIDTLDGEWVQTSYNTWGGVHYDENMNPSEDQSKALRMNYAGIGSTYDRERDAFIPPRRFNGWLLDQETLQWVPPAYPPEDGNVYVWDNDLMKFKNLGAPKYSDGSVDSQSTL